MSKRLDIFLWLFVLVPAVTFGLTEANKLRLVWFFRVVDFFDLVLLAPFFGILLLAITACVFDGQRGLAFWTALGLIVLALYGHAMHLTANSIDTFSTEIRGYRQLIPEDTYALIHFLDEDLGHWLFFLGLFGVIGVWTLQPAASSSQAGSAAWAGGLFGLIYAVAVIESSHAWSGPILAAWLIGCALIRHTRDRAKGLPITRLPAFALAAGACLLVGQAIYLLIFGDFIQPSQLGF